MSDLLAVVLLAVLLVIALRFLIAGLHTARRSVVPAAEPSRDPRKGFACHRTSCGHMTLPHDDTPEGWRCSGCNRINPDAA
ncbi:hypothetical protein [Streptomyces parvus]|uniref:hypothetical protein n=1 Tax=Streptomyces parvus TaxID=66428 RepID=UPI0034088C3A